MVSRLSFLDNSVVHSRLARHRTPTPRPRPQTLTPLLQFKLIKKITAPPPGGKVKDIGPYVLGRTIGEGTTGKVKLAMHRKTGRQVAVKIIEALTLNADPELRTKIEREIAVMKLIDHPHVLQLIDVYETDTQLYIVMEHAEGGELFQHLVRRGRLTIDEALVFFQQIIHGVDFCHTFNVVHRDLKPENLLLDAKHERVLIGDFGYAAFAPGTLLETSCGSPHYASPEIIRGKQYSGPAADVWSCGVILYALVAGYLPFDGDAIPQILKRVCAGEFEMPSDVFVDSGLRDLIKRMLTLDPRRRATMADVKAHPWFCSNGKSEPPVPPIERKEISTPFPMGSLDDELLASLFSLGFGTNESILDNLVSEGHTVEKDFYHILQQKKLLHPRASTWRPAEFNDPESPGMLMLKRRREASLPQDAAGSVRGDRSSSVVSTSSSPSSAETPEKQTRKRVFSFNFGKDRDKDKDKEKEKEKEGEEKEPEEKEKKRLWQVGVRRSRMQSVPGVTRETRDADRDGPSPPPSTPAAASASTH